MRGDIVERMKWFRAHFALAILAALGILVLASAAAMRDRSPASERSIAAWSGNGQQEILPPENDTRLPEAAITEESGMYWSADTAQPIFPYRIPFANDPQKPDAERAQEDSFDLNSFKEMLNQSLPKQNMQASPAATSSDFSNPYLFVPRGLVSMSSLAPPEALTQEQKAMFDYGNALGALIQSFDDSHKDTTAIMDAFFKDRGNQIRITPLLEVANDYERLAERISALGNVPPVLKDRHASFSLGYGGISKGLIGLTKTMGDKETADAVFEYNKSADFFIKNFVGLANFFTINGIKFSSGDSGSIFQFSR